MNHVLAGLLLTVAAYDVGAQTSPTGTDTLTITSGRPGRQLHLVLAGSQTPVTILGRTKGAAISADTITVSTPVQIAVPTPPFSFTVSTTAADSSEWMVIRTSRKPLPGEYMFETSFGSPVTFSRTLADSGTIVKASRVKALRVP